MPAPHNVCCEEGTMSSFRPKAKCLMPILVALTITAWLFAGEKTVTAEGKLVSASCYLRDGVTTNDMEGAKECGSSCLKQGKPGGLLTPDNTFYILDGPSLRLAPYVGQEIRVTGEQHGKDILSIHSAWVKMGGGWEAIDTHYHPEK